MAKKSNSDKTKQPPFETHQLRQELTEFFKNKVVVGEKAIEIGSFKWGAYAFYDYDGEPIYVGQTCEGLRTRIRRHLTNQRTDAVAMSVLDPFEVKDIEVWPLPEFQQIANNNKEEKHLFDAAKAELNALEYMVFQGAVNSSEFGAVLNENCLLYTSPSPRDRTRSRMPSSA